MLSNDSAFNVKNDLISDNQNVITDNNIFDTINQPDKTLNTHKVGENVINSKTNCRNLTNNDNVNYNALTKLDNILSRNNVNNFQNDILGNNKNFISNNDNNDSINQSNETLNKVEVDGNEINLKINTNHETLKQLCHNKKLNEDIISNQNNIAEISNQLHISTSDVELYNNRFLSEDNDNKTDSINTLDTKFDFKDNENVVCKTDKVNERIQRLALLANSNYSLIGNDIEKANLIFGNGKIIEGVIDFKLNDRIVNSESRLKVTNNSDCDLNETIESKN